MIAKLRTLSLLDIVLVIVVVVGAAITFLIWQANASAEQEKASLELRSRSVERGLSEADRKLSLESLRQRLEQLRSTPVESPFPTSADVAAIPNQVLLDAQENDVTIISWDTSYLSISIGEEEFPGIKHRLLVKAGTNGLIDFIEALAQVATANAIQNIEIAELQEGVGTWQMGFELIVYYR